MLAEFDRTAVATAGNTGMTLCLAVNYGGRTEIADAASDWPTTSAPAGSTRRRSMNRGSSGYLDTAGHVDPDLLIRTAGEMRVSNFLLWQISYAEI